MRATRDQLKAHVENIAQINQKLHDTVVRFKQVNVKDNNLQTVQNLKLLTDEAKILADSVSKARGGVAEVGGCEDGSNPFGE